MLYLSKQFEVLTANENNLSTLFLAFTHNHQVHKKKLTDLFMSIQEAHETLTHLNDDKDTAELSYKSV